MNVKYKLGILLGVIMVSTSLYAQPDCRSIIGAHIKPIGNSPVSWGVEGLTAIGFMPDRYVANWNLYGAIDYTKGNHQFYFEGAYKDYYNSASNPEGEAPQTDLPEYNRPTPTQFGLRELNYKYSGEGSQLSVGVRGLKTDDYFLFDERMLGITATKKWNALEVSANIGTVTEQIARFSNVCGTRHIYNIIHRSQYNFVGDRPFETNLAGVFLTWKPGAGKSKSVALGNDDTFETFDDGTSDEFSTEGFETIDEFSNDEFTTGEIGKKTKKSFLKLNETGAFFYEEFGSGFHEYKYYSGVFSQFTLPFDTELETELVDQYILNDHALAYWLSLSKAESWGDGSSTNFKLSYLGKFNINDGAHFYPAFSNLFLGEVLRLDAIDLPLLSGTIKHFFNHKYKPTLQLNGVMQLKNDKSREGDLLAGVKLFKHVRVTGILGYLSSGLLEQDYWLARMELRIAL